MTATNFARRVSDTITDLLSLSDGIDNEALDKHNAVLDDMLAEIEQLRKIERKRKSLRHCIDLCLHDLTVSRFNITEHQRLDLVINLLRWTIEEDDR